MEFKKEVKDMYKNRITFGDLLKAHRILKGISQEELSIACFWQRDRSCISKLERKIRNPKNDTVNILAEGLNLKGREKALFSLLGRLNYLHRTETSILTAIKNGELVRAKNYSR